MELANEGVALVEVRNAKTEDIESLQVELWQTGISVMQQARLLLSPDGVVDQCVLYINGNIVHRAEKPLSELLEGPAWQNDIEVVIACLGAAARHRRAKKPKVTVNCFFGGAASRTTVSVPASTTMSELRHAIANEARLDSRGAASRPGEGDDGAAGAGGRLHIDLFTGLMAVHAGSPCESMTVRGVQGLLGQGDVLDLFAVARAAALSATSAVAAVPAVEPASAAAASPGAAGASASAHPALRVDPKVFRCDGPAWVPLDVDRPDGAAAAASGRELRTADKLSTPLPDAARAELGAWLYMVCSGAEGVHFPALLARLREASGFPPGALALAAMRWAPDLVDDSLRCALATSLWAVGRRLGMEDPLARPSVVLWYLLRAPSAVEVGGGVARGWEGCAVPRGADDPVANLALPPSVTDSASAAARSGCHRVVPLLCASGSGERLVDPVLMSERHGSVLPVAADEVFSREEARRRFREGMRPGAQAEVGYVDCHLVASLVARRALALAPRSADRALVWAPPTLSADQASRLLALPGPGRLLGQCASLPLSFGTGWAAAVARQARPSALGADLVGRELIDGTGPAWTRPVLPGRVLAAPVPSVLLLEGLLAVVTAHGDAGDGVEILRPHTGELRRQISADVGKSVHADGPVPTASAGDRAPAAGAASDAGRASKPATAQRTSGDERPPTGAAGAAGGGAAAEARGTAAAVAAALTDTVDEVCVVVVHRAALPSTAGPSEEELASSSAAVAGAVAALLAAVGTLSPALAVSNVASLPRAAAEALRASAPPSGVKPPPPGLAASLAACPALSMLRAVAREIVARACGAPGEGASEAGARQLCAERLCQLAGRVLPFCLATAGRPGAFAGEDEVDAWLAEVGRWAQGTVAVLASDPDGVSGPVVDAGSLGGAAAEDEACLAWVTVPSSRPGEAAEVRAWRMSERRRGADPTMRGIICAATAELLTDPVMAADGKIYQRRNAPPPRDELVAAPHLLQGVGRFLAANPHGWAGAPARAAPGFRIVPLNMDGRAAPGRGGAGHRALWLRSGASAHELRVAAWRASGFNADWRPDRCDLEARGHPLASPTPITGRWAADGWPGVDGLSVLSRQGQSSVIAQAPSSMDPAELARVMVDRMAACREPADLGVCFAGDDGDGLTVGPGPALSVASGFAGMDHSPGSGRGDAIEAVRRALASASEWAAILRGVDGSPPLARVVVITDGEGKGGVPFLARDGTGRLAGSRGGGPRRATGAGDLLARARLAGVTVDAVSLGPGGADLLSVAEGTGGLALRPRHPMAELWDVESAEMVRLRNRGDRGAGRSAPGVPPSCPWTCVAGGGDGAAATGGAPASTRPVAPPVPINLAIEACQYAAEAVASAARSKAGLAGKSVEQILTPVRAALPVSVRPLVRAIGRLPLATTAGRRWLRSVVAAMQDVTAMSYAEDEAQRLVAARITPQPVRDSATEWSISVAGTGDGPYGAGAWEARLTFPPDFPRLPPLLRLVTRIHHPNVWPGGELCMHELGAGWKPDGGIPVLLTSLVSLLDGTHEPTVKHAANTAVAAQWLHEPEQFLADARECTARFARPRAHALRM